MSNSPLTYTLRVSKRARRLSMTVHEGGTVVVTAPRYSALETIERFVQSNAKWIMRQLTRLVRVRENKVSLPGGRADYLAHREEARSLITERLAELNRTYGFDYKRVSIKDTTSRWGSCSRQRNLNFSYKLLYVPAELRDYVVVHELCHLRYMSHGPRFWELVSRAIPDHKQRRRELRKYSLS